MESPENSKGKKYFLAPARVLAQRGLATLLSVFIAGNSVASSVVEKSFWRDRRQAALAGERHRHPSAVQLASAICGPSLNPSGFAAGSSFGQLRLENLPIQVAGNRPHQKVPPLPPVISKILQSIPNENGSVRSITLPSGTFQRIVIHIQDVHENIEAQIHISQTIQGLLSSGAVGGVGLEGALNGANSNQSGGRF